MKAAARTRADWARLVKELDESDARTSDFAALRGVNVRTLAWWRAWFRRQGTPGTGDDSRVRARPGTSTRRGTRFVQVVPAAPNDGCATRTDEADVTVDIGPARVSVRRGVDMATLTAVLSALGIGRAQ